MSVWSRLFKRTGGRQPATSRAATSEADATRVHPLSMTHIIMIADKSESLRHLPDLANEVLRVWATANQDMASVLAGSGIPTYYIEADRYRPGTLEINRDHVLGPHLNALQVPSNHSVFVQFVTIEVDGRRQEVTLETVYRTEEARCIVSLQPLRPYVG